MEPVEETIACSYYNPQFAPYQGGQAQDPVIQQWFHAVDKDRSGKINATELRAALSNGQGGYFTENACQLMIGMFDKNKTGVIDITQFQHLYYYVNQWLGIFRTYDRDRSGYIEEPELMLALQQMGFRFSPEFIKFVISKSDFKNHQRMSVDQFIVVCVQIQRLTEAFRMRDKQMQGMITIAFEEFLRVCLECGI